MLNRVASVTLSVLVAMAAHAKEKETVQIQVVSLQTKLHGHPPGEVFEYTDIMFTVVGGKKVTYVCEQRGDDCPVMESGKMYMANREGNVIYVSMNSPKGTPFLVKYKELDGW
jgi:hypothetical protein